MANLLKDIFSGTPDELNELFGLGGPQEDAYKKMFKTLGNFRDLWTGYTASAKGTAEQFLQGINPAAESGIAGQRNAATDRILGGLSGRGTVNSGARAALEGLASRQATGALAQSRMATQQTGLQALLGLGGQYGGLLGQQGETLGGVTRSYLQAESPALKIFQQLLGSIKFGFGGGGGGMGGGGMGGGGMGGL